MLTDAEYQTWLADSAPAERCLLIALESDSGMVRVGWPAFISRPEDEYPNLAWDDVLTELPEFKSSGGNLEVGDLEIVWPDEINELFSRYWRGRRYRIWMGSQTWPMDDFRIIASGRISSVERTSPHRLRFKFLNAAVVLDSPIVETEEYSTLTLDLSEDGGSDPRDFDPDVTQIYHGVDPFDNSFNLVSNDFGGGGAL